MARDQLGMVETAYPRVGGSAGHPGKRVGSQSPASNQSGEPRGQRLCGRANTFQLQIEDEIARDAFVSPAREHAIETAQCSLAAGRALHVRAGITELRTESPAFAAACTGGQGRDRSEDRHRPRLATGCDSSLALGELRLERLDRLDRPGVEAVR